LKHNPKRKKILAAVIAMSQETVVAVNAEFLRSAADGHGCCGAHIESVFYVIVNLSGLPNLDTPTTMMFAVGLGNYMQLRLEHLFRKHCRETLFSGH
jgi:hypothetical protein